MDRSTTYRVAIPPLLRRVLVPLLHLDGHGRNRNGKPSVGRPQPNDKTKAPVLALVERKGRVRAFPIERVDGRTIQTASSRAPLHGTPITPDNTVCRSRERLK